MKHDLPALRFYALINGEPDGLATWRQSVDTGWQARPAFPAAPAQVDGYPRAIAALRTAFPDLHFAAEEVIDRDGFVAVRSTVTGTHRGEFAGVAATGRLVTFTALDIHQVKDNVIIETWHVEDFAGVVRQLRA